MDKRKPNRLIKEKSPYLRQHAYNPVDWYPWSEEAFEKAKRENKPIFLSIGYSTCHWCHVMEKESFEDEEIAEILNKYFVPIKVDREERPDIDAFYMSVCQAMTGSGGWPLTIIMTPDKEPFFAGTYFPKESFFGRPGLKDILLRIKELWEKDREKVLNTAKHLVKALEEASREKAQAKLGEEVLHRAFSELFSSYDEHFGGFGNAPKFPIPHNLMFLGRYYYRYKREQALKMIDKTLTSMRMGGIWDHVGFGFHRYSTDKEWLLPHFEKMLYDQALLLIAYTEGYQLLGKGLFKRTSEEIVEFLKRDMLSPEGASYSAWDADSEGEEGKFYTWSLEELREALSPDELEFTLKVFNLQEEGNYLEEATRRKTGRNILYVGRDYEEVAKELGMDRESFEKKLEKVREKLFRAREKRVKPLRDEKILTDWNGLAIAGLSYSGKALGKEEWIKLAKRCADFILERMLNEEGLLLHRYMEGEAKYYGFLEDYAYLIWGLLELYEATLESSYLEKALQLQEVQIKHFWNNENGGFFQTPDFFTDIPVRKKEVYDGATPSGNSVSAYNLIRLGRLIGRKELEDYGYKTLEAFSWELANFPSAHTFSLIALDLAVNGSKELVIVPEDDTWKEVKRRIDSRYIPDLLILLKDEKTEKLSNFVKSMKPLDGRTTYYLCKNYACEEPRTEFDESMLER
ncbi:thioredoxin domain-containing protein [Aquifex pyrophilus]